MNLTREVEGKRVKIVRPSNQSLICAIEKRNRVEIKKPNDFVYVVLKKGKVSSSLLCLFLTVKSKAGWLAKVIKSEICFVQREKEEMENVLDVVLLHDGTILKGLKREE